MDDIRRCSSNVKEELLLAKAQADYQDQQLQGVERKEASDHRRGLTSFMSRVGINMDKTESMQVQRDEREARERRQRLLALLSSYDHLTPLRQSREKRHLHTAEWLLQTLEFDRWMNNDSCQVLWCSGKIGSGKTILAANTIDHILRTKKGPDIFLTFFFLRFDDEQSLNANTILRSIIRQTLDSTSLSAETTAWLQKFENFMSPDLGELAEFLRMRIQSSKAFYIIIDGLDECKQVETKGLLQKLTSVIAVESKVKLLVFSRESLSGIIKKHFPAVAHVSMACQPAQGDIAAYIKATVEERVENGDLVIGNRSLVNDITTALVNGSDGMFLWVTFQIDELCATHSDEDIRKALQDLPESLEETFNRALDRILKRREAKMAQRAFTWIGAAKRPLSLEQLREVLPIEIEQPYSRPEQSLNRIEDIQSWCENLVQIDEELRIVQFAHHSIHQFLSGKPHQPRFTKFHFDVEEADHFAGEICVTYLGFSDFQRALTRRSQPLKPFKPTNIADMALNNETGLATSVSMWRSFSRTSRETPTNFDVTRLLESQRRHSQPLSQLEREHPFLEYASEGWLLHSSAFEKGKSKMWYLWRNLVMDNNELTQKPWSNTQLPLNNEQVAGWALQAKHCALICLILEAGWSSSPNLVQLLQFLVKKGDMAKLDPIFDGIDHDVFEAIRGSLLQEASRHGHVAMVDLILARNASFNLLLDWRDGEKALMAAVEAGHFLVVKQLLDAHNLDEIRTAGREVFRVAVENDHSLIVEMLLELGVEPDIDILEVALDSGHAGVFKRLVAAGVAISGNELFVAASKGNVGVFEELRNLEPRIDYQVLRVAAQNGHLAIVEMALDTLLEVDPPDELMEESALEQAALNGHDLVIETLLQAKAEVNRTASPRTALQAAAGGGHLSTFKRLLRAGAEINVRIDADHKMSTLEIAVEGGCLAVVEHALEASAEVNREPGPVLVPTALQLATHRGHLQIVKRLLDAGAEVDGRSDSRLMNESAVRVHLARPNPDPRNYRYLTALQIAAGQGDLALVDTLLEAGADVNAAPGFYEDIDLSALAGAAEGGHLAVVERLLQKGVSLYTGGHNLSLLQLAVIHGHLDVVDSLLDAAAQDNYDGRDADFTLALLMAAEEGDLTVVERLLKVNTKVGASDVGYGGEKVLARAKKTHPAIYRMIIEARHAQKTQSKITAERNRLFQDSEESSSRRQKRSC